MKETIEEFLARGGKIKKLKAIRCDKRWYTRHKGQRIPSMFEYRERQGCLKVMTYDFEY